MKCPTCGKELYDNGEDHFNCPFCGAEVVGGKMAAEATAGGELSKVKPGLQELIEVMRPQEAAYARKARVLFTFGQLGYTRGLGVGAHGAEFIDFERFAVQADALLRIDHGTAVAQFDSNGADEGQR